MARRSPFLELPIELRTYIYDNLVPDIEVGSRPTPPFRKDGQSCAPALFAVNRAVYHEFLKSWYGNPDALYRIYIGETHMILLNQTIYPQKRKSIEVPPVIRHMRNLKIHLDVDYFSKHCLHDHLRAQEFIAAVLGMLQPGKCALMNLHLHLSAGVALFLKARETTKLRRILEGNIRIFRRMRGLHSVRATFQLDNFGSNGHMLAISTRGARAKFEESARPCLDSLEAEMMCPIEREG